MRVAGAGCPARPPFCGPMHLLYLDDSGSVSNRDDEHIILAGLSVFERQVHWHLKMLDAIAEEICPDEPEKLEFRGGDVIVGKKRWRAIDKTRRIQAYKDALRIIGNSRHANLFGAAIYKAAVSPDDPMERAFEQLCNRFDRFLHRLHKRGDTQRGLIILDKSSYETSLQKLAIEFRTIGHKWGQVYNLCDVPLFVDSMATRMIQFSDLIAHAVRRYYEKNDATYFDLFSHKFDNDGGVMRGLVHVIPPSRGCGCLSCRQRRVE